MISYFCSCMNELSNWINIRFFINVLYKCLKKTVKKSHRLVISKMRSELINVFLSGARRWALRAIAASRTGLLWRGSVQRHPGTLVARRKRKCQWTAAGRAGDSQQLSWDVQLSNGGRRASVLSVPGFLAHGCQLQTSATLRSMRRASQRRVLPQATEQSYLLSLFGSPSCRYTHVSCVLDETWWDDHFIQ